MASSEHFQKLFLSQRLHAESAGFVELRTGVLAQSLLILLDNNGWGGVWRMRYQTNPNEKETGA